jgi:hypothetical protein
LTNFIEECKKLLSETWTSLVKELARTPGYNTEIPKQLRDVIDRCINSQTKSYRYVLPTQLLAKIADISLDSHCIQAGRGKQGDFDARSVCDKVIIPFDRENHNVLGGAPEPYVNNPLRVPEASAEYRGNQKNKKGWDDLIFVLDSVERRQDPDFTASVFKQTLIETYRRLASVQVTYPVPKRISLKRTQQLVNSFLSASSGGERVLTVVAALMDVIGERFGLFAEVRRGSITSADKSSGLVADIECRDSAGNIVLAVEVKDRELIFNHIAVKLPDMRSKRVSEILYIAQQGIRQENHHKIEELVDREFASGQNIYIFENILDFCSGILILIGEDGRRKFLERVGANLDRYSAAIPHKTD